MRDFDGLMVSLASKEDIEYISNGSVDNPDTINYRTGKPKRGGLFCEVIFGPVKNYECQCGKYKGLKYRGIACENCHVEITNSRVRRTRMGHIDLASPVVNPLYKEHFSGIIPQLLNISNDELDTIINYIKYYVTSQPDEFGKDKMIGQLDSDFFQKLSELDEALDIANNSSDAYKNKQKILLLYENNKKELSDEWIRLKSEISNLSAGKLISASDYENFFSKFDDVVHMETGPIGLLNILKSLDIKTELKNKIENLKGKELKREELSTLKSLINFFISGINPCNMILQKMPVIPPELRPIVKTKDGIVSSDLNSLYRKILMRNIRLKKMIQIGMPDILKKNEIRLLQNAVDEFFYGIKNDVNTDIIFKSKKKLKKNIIKDEQVEVDEQENYKTIIQKIFEKGGVFDNNLSGKYVDYSGVSEIVVDPKLKVYECGMPISIIIELLKPNIIHEMLKRNIVCVPSQAEKLIKDNDPLIYSYIDDVIKDKYIILNKNQPNSRYGLQAFKIKLSHGKAIKLNPLIYRLFKLEFHSSSVDVHLPISDEAQKEARDLLSSYNNIIDLKFGDNKYLPSKEILLGIVYLTDFFDIKQPLIKSEDDWKYDLPVFARFSCINDVCKAFINGEVGIKNKIILLLNNNQAIETTVGRVLFNSKLPDGMEYINKCVDELVLSDLLNEVLDRYGYDSLVKLTEEINLLGLKYSYYSSISPSLNDIKNLEFKDNAFLDKCIDRTINVISYYNKGYFSIDEKNALIREIWSNAKKYSYSCIKDKLYSNYNFQLIIRSGCINIDDIIDSFGIKGLIYDGKMPIERGYFKGLKPSEFFTLSNELNNNSLNFNTLSKIYTFYHKLYDAMQGILITTDDCNTDDYLKYNIKEIDVSGNYILSHLFGRVLAEDVVDNFGNQILCKGSILGQSEINKLRFNKSITYIKVRSPLTCHCEKGICQQCYGMDLSTNRFIEIGTPIGVISSQSIGELLIESNNSKDKGQYILDELENSFDHGMNEDAGNSNIFIPIPVSGEISEQQKIVKSAHNLFCDSNLKINVKYLEVLVSYLFSKVFIKDSGSSGFVVGEYVNYRKYFNGNKSLKKLNKNMAIGQRVMFGLSGIKHITNSWISSFSMGSGEGKLIEASIKGAIDDLSDITSNVIIGRSLPIGISYRKKYGYGYNYEGYDEEGYDKYGFGRDGYNKEGYDKDGYNKEGFDRNGYNRLGRNIYGKNKQTGDKYDLEGYNMFGYNKEGFDRYGWNKYSINKYTGNIFDSKGYDRNGYDKYGYNVDGYDKDGWDRSGINKYTGDIYNDKGYDKNGYDKYGYNEEGYDKDGYNREGYDKLMYDREGFDRCGFNKQGYGRDGYNREGYDIYGFDKNGYDKYGFNEIGINKYTLKWYDEYGYNWMGYDGNGFNRKGYNRGGFDREGFDREGFDLRGFNRNGYNRAGYDRFGYDRGGYSKKGYNREGVYKFGYGKYGYNRDNFDKNGINKYTGKFFNKEGYDKEGFDVNGYNRKGYNREGFDNEGYDELGFDRTGYDRNGYNRIGYDRLGYDKQGYDISGFNNKGRNEFGINKYTSTKYDLSGYDVNGYNEDGYNKNGFDGNGGYRISYIK